MMSVGSNFLCERLHGADPLPHPQRPPMPDPPPCGRHKWMAPKVNPSEKCREFDSSVVTARRSV